MNPTRSSEGSVSWRRAALWLCVFGIYVACGTLTAPQQWRQDLGPVVPHDSFPADCSLCHVGEGWFEIREDFEFDHGEKTGVELVGAHATASCLRCHNDRGPVAVFAARGCSGCHVDPHRGKLGNNCQDCHSENLWPPLQMIQKHARTRFPLVGAHAAVACFACHPGAQVGNFEGLDTRCATCHQQDLGRATNPNHVVQGWTVDCQRCHAPLDWSPARFDHPASFPLTAGHAGHGCADCHGAGNVFTGLSTDCASCHLDDYQATRDPNHPLAGFSTNCQQCHNTTIWDNAQFDHPASFPLSGGHAGRSCADCHGTTGIFTGLSTACASCHLADYQATRNPNHQASGFSTVCQQCHNTTRWEGARFDHRFPIDRGPHGNLSCADCHTNPATPNAFSCTHCHEHRQSEMADKHSDENGYVWESSACFRCHPTGN